MILTDGPTLRVVLPDGVGAATVLEPALTLEDVERRHILDVLEQTGWRISGGQWGGAHSRRQAHHARVPHEEAGHRAEASRGSDFLLIQPK